MQVDLKSICQTNQNVLGLWVRDKINRWQSGSAEFMSTLAYTLTHTHDSRYQDIIKAVGQRQGKCSFWLKKKKRLIRWRWKQCGSAPEGVSVTNGLVAHEYFLWGIHSSSSGVRLTGYGYNSKQYSNLQKPEWNGKRTTSCLADFAM